MCNNIQYRAMPCNNYFGIGILHKYIYGQYYGHVFPNGSIVQHRANPSNNRTRSAPLPAAAVIGEPTFADLLGGIESATHLFRDSAVYTVADNMVDQMGVASALLQHTDPRITELHYNKGASTSAAKKYVAIVTGLEAGSNE